VRVKTTRVRLGLATESPQLALDGLILSSYAQIGCLMTESADY